MKSVSGKGDSAVSEVIGTVLVFAIFISIFTTVSAYYIPATPGPGYERRLESNVEPV